MKIERETQSYNQRRYGRPWIAKVVLEDNNLKFVWGQWIGDARNGSEGLLVLSDIDIGDFFAQGQKDNRQPKNSSPNYYRLGADGKGEPMEKAEVYKALTAPRTAPANQLEYAI